MWFQDWLRHIRSVATLSVEPTTRDDAAIANQQFALENGGFDIIAEDDEETDFMIIYADHQNQLGDSANIFCIEAASVEERFPTGPQQLAEEYEDDFVSRYSTHVLELSGRGDHNHIFEDLRSASQADKRDKTTRQKYYNFRYVKPGDFDALQRQFDDMSGAERRTLSDGDQHTMTKSELYRQAQLPPRPPKYHRRHIDKIRGTLSQRVDVRRENRKHSKSILKHHLRDL